jgi:predicted Zn finger-like uncharacterized protein
MNPTVTRCPKCGTAFRITSTQLESAKGAVRCGSCLNIFKALDHLVKSTETSKAEPNAVSHAAQAVAATESNTNKLSSSVTTTANQAPIKSQVPANKITAAQTVSTPKAAAKSASQVVTPVSAKPVIDKQKVLEDEDDVLISDDMDQVENPEARYEFDGFVDLNMQPKQSVSLFEREIRYEPEAELEQTDESWAENLLEDDEDPEPIRKKKLPAEAVTPTVTTPEFGIRDEHDSDSRYEQPLFSLVSDPDDKEQGLSEEFLKVTSLAEPTEKSTRESGAFASALFDEAGDTQLEPEPQQPSGKKPIKSSKIRAFDSSRAALLMNIIPAPVEFTSRRMRSWYQQKLWPSLALLMAVLLLAQIAYFKFHYFSRIEPFRTGYALACSLLNCKVEELVDVSKIGINNLIVRSHPTAESALIVDAILINNASFDQPFPDLVLAFSAIDETPVASRRFTPKEYLAGELAGMKRIPQKQPVHITLELADPGPDAPNYHLSIP